MTIAIYNINNGKQVSECIKVSMRKIINREVLFISKIEKDYFTMYNFTSIICISRESIFNFIEICLINNINLKSYKLIAISEYITRRELDYIISKGFIDVIIAPFSLNDIKNRVLAHNI